MIRRRQTVALTAVLTLGVSMTAAAQQQPYRASDQQAQELANRINTRTDTFRASFDRAIDRSRIRGSRAADAIAQSVIDLQQATSHLRDRVNDRRSDAAAVEDVLTPATIIDTFMKANQLDATAQRDWQAIGRDLDELARAYGVTWNRTGWQQAPSSVSNQRVEQLISQTTRDADQFRRSLDLALARGRIDTSRDEDDIIRFLTGLSEATNHLNDHVDRRQIVTNNVNDLMQRGVSIDGFMQRHPLTPRAQSDWLIVRRDLDGLATRV